MTKEEDFNKYISNLCKIIKSGDPKYLAYVSKEYLKNRRNNQIATIIIENAIQVQSKKEGSVYAIFIDNDNTMNIEAIANISKITNVAEFVKNVNALSEQDVDFGDLTSNELVIQGMQIAEELAKELEDVEMQIESLDNIEMQETAALQIEQKTDETLNKLAVTGGISATIIATFNSIKSKIALKIEKIRQAIIQKKSDKIKNDEEIQHEQPIKQNEDKVIDPFMKVKVDGLAAISRTKLDSDKNLTYDSTDGMTDDDMSEDESNNTQEDDEPDI